MPFVRILSARFSVIDIGAHVVHRYYLVIVLFFIMRWALLTDNQRQLLYWLRSADVRALIKIRALGAENFLLPFMSKVNSVTTSDEYLKLANDVKNQLEDAKSDPCELLVDTIEPISTKALMIMIYRLIPYLRAKDKHYEATRVINELTNSNIDTNDEIVIDSSIIIEEIDSANEAVTQDLEHDQIANTRSSVPPTSIDINSSKISIIRNDIRQGFDDIIIPKFTPNWMRQAQSSSSTSLPNIEDRIRFYAYDYVCSIIEVFEKHKDKGIQAGQSINPTTRGVERVFGKVKELLDINVATRATILFSKILLSEMSVSYIQAATNIYTDKINAYQWAWATIRNHKQGREMDELYFNAFSRQLAEAIDKESKLELNYLIKKYLISKAIILPEDDITVDKLKYSLIKLSADIPKYTRKIDLLESVAHLIADEDHRLLALELCRKLKDEKKKITE